MCSSDLPRVRIKRLGSFTERDVTLARVRLDGGVVGLGPERTQLVFSLDDGLDVRGSTGEHEGRQGDAASGGGDRSEHHTRAVTAVDRRGDDGYDGLGEHVAVSQQGLHRSP